MSDITTTALFVTRTGTGWTIDVTLLQLSEILPLKDFTVIDVAAQIILNNANFTKTSSTVLTYTGPALVGAVALELRRNTPIAERYYNIPHGAYLNSQAMNEEVDRILRKLNEIEGFPGSVLGAFILDQAYGPAWATDDVTSRTAKNVYDIIETLATSAQLTTLDVTLNNAIALRAPINNPALTGTPTAPTPSPVTDASTKIATTQFVSSAIGNAAGYKMIGSFTGADAASGILNLSAVTGNIRDNRIYFKFRGLFQTDVAIFLRPNELVTSVSNSSIQSTFSSGTPLYNQPNFGSYLNSFWIGYGLAAADSKVWGTSEFQWFSDGASKEVHAMSKSMMHAPSVNYGTIDIFSLAANAAYTTPKTSFTVFGVDLNTGNIARNLPTNFVLNAYAYITN